MLKKGLVSLLGASALLAPVDKAESATVLSNISQTGSSAKINYTFQNDDSGATYNSATLDLNTILGLVVNNIVANNPAYNSTADVYNDIGLNITNTGDVYSGWSSAINSSTGVLSLNHGPFGYTEWPYPLEMKATLNLGNMLDYNGNGVIDANETLAFSGTADNAFTGYATNPGIFWQADAQGITIIPEPSSALLGGLGALALLGRRREPVRVSLRDPQAAGSAA